LALVFSVALQLFVLMTLLFFDFYFLSFTFSVNKHVGYKRALSSGNFSSKYYV